MFTYLGLKYLDPSEKWTFQAKGFVYFYNSYSWGGWVLLFVDNGGVSILRQADYGIGYVGFSYSNGELTITNTSSARRAFRAAVQNLSLTE